LGVDDKIIGLSLNPEKKMAFYTLPAKEKM
jgi:hypothetical protein